MALPLKFALVGACWGCTNPLLKRGCNVDSTAATDPKHGGLRWLLDPLKSFRRPTVLIPYAVNQAGSALYWYLIASEGTFPQRLLCSRQSLYKRDAIESRPLWLSLCTDLSMAVPICNSLTFVFTALTGAALGEAFRRPLVAWGGIALVLCGTAFCISAQKEH
ncbi:unnamed protein product [Phaeothamnion confervicola]